MPPPPSRSKKRPLVLTSPKLLEGQRLAGTKMVTPDDETKTLIHNSGVSKIVGTFRFCLDETGTPESVLPLRSTGLSRYDARIIAAMREWRYTPYLLDGQPIPICSYVTFIYSQR